MIDVCDFINLCTEDGIEVEIYSLSREEVVFKGDGKDARFCDYAYEEVLSFDAPEKPWAICINIE